MWRGLGRCLEGELHALDLRGGGLAGRNHQDHKFAQQFVNGPTLGDDGRLWEMIESSPCATRCR